MRLLLAILLWAIAAPARAEPAVVVSGSTDAVAVTLYRDPGRAPGDIDRDNPGAFALIAETRTLDLPPGVVTVRFEGVAGGIVPQSAILFGTDPRERNRDAALLSQKGLVDGFTGQSVILKRTDPATGVVTEERATVRSAADRLVLTTPRGVEAVYCSGLTQTLIYPGVPAGLSAKPVLTMTTRDQPGGRFTITLAYIATGFDWDASYVATLSGDGKSMSLLSWLTMASGDETSFVDATTSAVAGRINRSDDTRDDTGTIARQEASDLDTRSDCWPAGTTSDIYAPPPPPPPPPMAVGFADEGMEIIVTAQRRAENVMASPIAVTAVGESLGDLKLYRIPIPVTVASHSQKQVAFLQAAKVKGEIIYRSRIDGEANDPEMLFRFRNRKSDGLGQPLPAGSVVLYQDSRFGTQVIGESVIADKAVDEEVEMTFGEPTGVELDSDSERLPGSFYKQVSMTLNNANPYPVTYEFEFPNGGPYRYSSLPGGLIAKPGKKVWRVILAPASKRVLTYRFADADDGEE